MSLLFIRYFFISLCSSYSYYKLLDINLNKLMNKLILIVHSSAISITTFILSSHNATLRIYSMILLSFIMLSSLYKISPTKSLLTLLISYGLSYVFLYLSIPIICFAFLLTFKQAASIPLNMTHLPVGFLQVFFMFCIFKSQRLQKGISSLIKQNKTNIGIGISICFLLSITIFSLYQEKKHFIQFFINLIYIFLSTYLLYYWNHRITQTYKEKLRLANQKSLEDELTAKLIEIETLKADNERLAKIIHKDNKLIPAMHVTVTNFLENIDKLPSEELSARGQELSAQLYKMAKDRQGILTETQSKTNTLPQTGIHTIDGVLSYMETRAVKENITYKLRIDENIKELILNSVSEEDLCHLLSDLIENAIIATRYSNNNKQIIIHLGTLKNSILLEISDSGKEFDIETYQHFGYEKHTTHAEHGGSGIGLMDIWKIKKNNKISLQIYEYPPDSNAYTKKISFVFDRKNHFLMQTYRYKEIISSLTRGDLYVFPYESNENI